MPSSPKSMADLLGHMFQLVTVMFALTLLIYNDAISFVVLIIPSGILLSMTISGHKRDDYALLVFKLAVFLQSVVMWLSLMNQIWSSMDTSLLHDLYTPNLVKNSYSNGYVTEHDHTSIPKRRTEKKVVNDNGNGGSSKSITRKVKASESD